MPLRDLSFAVRTLRRSPVFTLAAVLTIALGIGASSAILSVTHAVLLRPLPYTDPARLVVMYMDLRARHTFGLPFSNENYADIRNGWTGVFEDMVAFPSGANVEQRPDCWVANRLSYDNANRNTFGLRPVGRLKPGVTLARAQEQVESVAATRRQDFPLQTTAGFYARLEPMHDTLVEEVRPAILALTGAATFLCAPRGGTGPDVGTTRLVKCRSRRLRQPSLIIDVLADG